MSCLPLERSNLLRLRRFSLDTPTAKTSASASNGQRTPHLRRLLWVFVSVPSTDAAPTHPNSRPTWTPHVFFERLRLLYFLSLEMRLAVQLQRPAAKQAPPPLPLVLRGVLLPPVGSGRNQNAHSPRTNTTTPHRDERQRRRSSLVQSRLKSQWLALQGVGAQPQCVG